MKLNIKLKTKQKGNNTMKNKYFYIPSGTNVSIFKTNDLNNVFKKITLEFDLRVKTKPLNQNGDIFYAPTDGVGYKINSIN
jgi:hypothetical protein